MKDNVEMKITSQILKTMNTTGVFKCKSELRVSFIYLKR